MELRVTFATNDLNRVYPKNAATETVPPKNARTKNLPIAVDFNGRKLTTNAGTLLLKLADEKLNFTQRIHDLIHDPRDPIYIVHQQKNLIAQRIYAITLGYEDVNDHGELRKDPALLAAIKNNINEEEPLGSASTLTRLENRITDEEVTNLTKLYVELFIESYKTPPKEIIIDVDATDDIIHGNQAFAEKYHASFRIYCELNFNLIFNLIF
jgi:hypothetical protein